MKRTQVIATKNSPYGARIKAGDVRNVSAAEAKVLVALKQARYPAPEPPKPKQVAAVTARSGTYQRRDMKAASPQSVELAVPGAKTWESPATEDPPA